MKVNQAQINFLTEILFPIGVFAVGVIGMYISYLKGKQDLRKMQKEKILKEQQLEATIENAKLALELATKNAQRIDKIEPKLVLQDIQNKLVLKALVNMMKSLKEHGINGKTDESIEEIENYLINN